jgi:hypothetical protein
MPNPKQDKTKITIQVDSGVEVDIVSKPASNPDQSDPSDPNLHPVKTTASPNYLRSYRWNAAGC